MFRLVIEPGVVLPWETFCAQRPAPAIALDGFVAGPPRCDMRGPWVNLNHHEGVNRLATRATCEQVLVSLRMGLLDSFRPATDPHGEASGALYVNDVDEDVCLSTWLFRNEALLYASNRVESIHRLVHMEGLLDTTAGAYPLPLDTPELQELAWVFQPFHQRCRGPGASSLTVKDKAEVVDEVCRHIGRYVRGEAGQVKLDLRYEKVGGGPGWSLVKETGLHSRTAMRAHGVRAFATIRPRADGRHNYAIARMSPYIDFPLEALFKALNAAEGIPPGASDRWDGGDTVGGSPRIAGSGLSPQQLAEVINAELARLAALPSPADGRAP